MKKRESQKVQPETVKLVTLSEKKAEPSKLPVPDPALIDRPRMGRYSNVAKGGEDILIRIMDWFAGEK